MFKNTAAKFIVFAYDATTNMPKTGDAANITAYVSKDYGTVTVLADTSATEMDATNAPGYYLFDAAQGETNADCLLVSAKSSTANIKVLGAPAVIYTRPQTGWLAPTTAARTLDVSATGEAGVDWGNVGSPTTAVDLTNTTIKTTQKVDVDTIKTNAVVNGGTVTFPTNATLASTTNLSAGSITTVTGNVSGNVGGNVTGSVGSVTGAVGSVTGNVGGNVTGSVGSLAAQAKADVNAEVVDTINVDTYAEPGQEAPAATNTLVKKIGYLFKLLRNKITQDTTTLQVFADDATTVDQKATVSDDGVTYTRGEIGSGP